MAQYLQEDRRVSCIRHPRNIGLPAIRCCEAYRRATGSCIGYAFDDCVFKNTAYEKLLDFIKRENRKIIFGYASCRGRGDDQGTIALGL